MKLSNEQLCGILKIRLKAAEDITSQGVIPGQLDTYELEQMIGRIKELKHVIEFIESYGSQ